MRIGMFTDTYSPQINGVVTSINTFIHEIEKRGHQVFVFAPKAEGAPSRDNIFYFKSFKYPKSPEHLLAYSTSGHMKKLRELDLDIIHSHTPFSIGLLAIFASKQYQIPLIHTYHTLFTEYVHYAPFGRSIGVHFSKAMSKNYCQKCDLVVVPSADMRKELQDYGVHKEIDIIPTGIDVNFKKLGDGERLRKKQKISPETKVILYAGRLAKEKNIEFLMRVYFDILKGRKDVLFVLLGDGPYRKHLEKRSKELKFGKKILFTGYISDKELLASWMKAADAFVFPSLTETQGLVLLESMSVGTPVIAIEARGVTDVVEDNVGCFASSSDEIEFALKLEQLLSSKTLRDKKGREAKQKAAAFSIENMTDKLLANYQRLIDVATKI